MGSQKLVNEPEWISSHSSLFAVNKQVYKTFSKESGKISDKVKGFTKSSDKGLLKKESSNVRRQVGRNWLMHLPEKQESSHSSGFKTLDKELRVPGLALNLLIFYDYQISISSNNPLMELSMESANPEVSRDNFSSTNPTGVFYEIA